MDEHENRRAGLRAQRGVMCSEECDEALEKGGLSAASEGVGDMDRGVGVGHRGQSAPVLLANDFQSGRQILDEAFVNCAAHGVPETPVASFVCDRPAQRRECQECHAWRYSRRLLRCLAARVENH